MARLTMGHIKLFRKIQEWEWYGDPIMVAFWVHLLVNANYEDKKESDEIIGYMAYIPCAGSGTTLLAAANLKRKAYGFEIKKDIFKEATTKVLPFVQRTLF